MLCTIKDQKSDEIKQMNSCLFRTVIDRIWSNIDREREMTDSWWRRLCIALHYSEQRSLFAIFTNILWKYIYICQLTKIPSNVLLSSSFEIFSSNKIVSENKIHRSLIFSSVEIMISYHVKLAKVDIHLSTFHNWMYHWSWSVILRVKIRKKQY